jgi:hypothetical protein
MLKKITILLFTAYVFGCNESNNSGTGPYNEILTDSAKLYRYLSWTDSAEYLNGYNYNHDFLSHIEINRDTLQLLNFLAVIYDSIKTYEEFPFTQADLVKFTYALEINGDDLIDVIFDGPTGGEESITKIFLNKGENLELAFTGYQDIMDGDFTGNKLNSFTLINPGCCADPQIIEYFYSVNYSNSMPTFHLDKTVGYLSQTEKPQKTFQNPDKFSTKSVSASLRPECYILDSIEFGVFGENGNLIANYKTGSTGRALGMKIEKGVEWMYVIMDPVHRLDNCQFPTFMEQPTEIKGWILKSETDIK